jgi:hypothetical protein
MGTGYEYDFKGKRDKFWWATVKYSYLVTPDLFDSEQSYKLFLENFYTGHNRIRLYCQDSKKPTDWLKYYNVDETICKNIW